MKNNTTPYKTNLHPNTLAATLSEQNTYAKINIHPDDKPHAEQLNEITKTALTKKSNELNIYIKTQTEERQGLMEALEKKSPYIGLLKNMEAATSQFKTDIFLEERKHILGTSELHARFFDLPAFLNIDQQKTMAYFFPWAPQIRGDVELMERCFFTALHFPLKIKKTAPKQINTNGMTIGHWVTNHTDSVGGISQKTNPCYRIEIGPVPMGDLYRFIPGSQQRRFMEEVLFPHFFPNNWDWETIIQVEEKNKNFTAPNTNGAAIIGTNSWVM